MQMQNFLLAPLLVVGMAGQVGASDVKLQNDTLQLNSSLNSNAVKMTVSGPKGFHFTGKRAGGNPNISIHEMNAYEDGVYNYEFTEVETIGEREVNDEFNGRGNTIQKIVKSKVVSGHFRIKNGAMVNSQEVEDPVSGNYNSVHKNIEK